MKTKITSRAIERKGEREKEREEERDFGRRLKLAVVPSPVRGFVSVKVSELLLETSGKSFFSFTSVSHSTLNI